MQAPSELDCIFLVRCAEEVASEAGQAGDDSHSQADTEDESTAETDAALFSAQQAQREAMLVSQNSLNDSRKRLLEVREAMQQQGQSEQSGQDQQHGQEAGQEEHQQAGNGQYFDQDQQPGQHQQQIQGRRSAERQQYHVQDQAYPQDQLSDDGQRQPYGQQHEQEQQDLGRSMAESAVDLHTAQQAQREALQAEQESLQDSRQGLQDVREAMHQCSQTGLRPLKPQLLSFFKRHMSGCHVCCFSFCLDLCFKGASSVSVCYNMSCCMAFIS